MPVNNNASAEQFLGQGYVPIKHQTRQGNHLVSWYRSPLMPGPNPAAKLALPVRTSDELVRYLSEIALPQSFLLARKAACIRGNDADFTVLYRFPQPRDVLGCFNRRARREHMALFTFKQ